MTALADAPPQVGIRNVEWRTFGLIIGCYALWVLAVFWLSTLMPFFAALGVTVLITLHGSLTHEVLHGHPFRSRRLNEALMALPLSLCIPYNRFRDLHLAHHRDSNLTDPYDDPESNFQDPAVWRRMPGWKKVILRLNNTLLGRIVLGPAIGQIAFLREEIQGARNGGRAIWLAWALHLPGVAVVIAIVAASGMPVWVYLLCAYAAMGLLKIRTFLEHRAHERSRARTVIIEDSGPLAFLFLNNNLHVVHHMSPEVSWYRLPALYRAGRERYLTVNDGYVYRSYGEVFRRYFWRAKDPVAHPLWPRG